MSKLARFVPKSGTFPKGFSVGAINCGIKKNGNSDLALIYSKAPCNAAAVYTQNRFQAAPVVITKQVLSENPDKVHSIILNSGCANAITGDQGLKDAFEMSKVTDIALGNPTNSTLVMSTGVIGQLLPLDKITAGIKSLANTLGSNYDAWLNCAKGMMTTDTFPKLVTRQVELAGKTYNVAGLTKGAGMISPNMATLLGAIVTDAPVATEALQKILAHSVNRSFNCISVDGDMSTNDTIALLANGKGTPITSLSEHYKILEKEIESVAVQLAQLLVRDGEGATKFVTLTVKGCTFPIAKKIAASVSNSPLVKTALYGRDANWGRILAAIGYTDVGDKSVPFDLSKISLSFVPVDGSQKLQLLVNGVPQEVDEERASQILQDEDLEIEIDMGITEGGGCKYWTCDLSHEYVTINGDYRS